MTAKPQPGPDQGPEHFLRALRNSHEHMRGVYRHGGCYELFRVLRTVWPKAQPWFIDGHVYTKINNRWYDIDGQWKPSEAQSKRLRPLFEEGRTPWKWRNRASEARRGFQERVLGTWKITPELRVRLWISRTRIKTLQYLLPLKLRRQVFNAILNKARADAINVYDRS